MFEVEVEVAVAVMTFVNIASQSSMEDAKDNAHTDASLIKLINCHLVHPANTVSSDPKPHIELNAELWIDPKQGKIVGPSTEASTIIDMKGRYISPGWIDIQLNGTMGMDFSDGQAQLSCDTYKSRFEFASSKLLRFGCTSFVATITSTRAEEYARLAPLLSNVVNERSSDMADCLGLHLEGPFINLTKAGAHNRDVLKIAPNGYKDMEAVYTSSLLNSGKVKIITCAPELQGVMSSIPDLTKRDIIVSIGHSVASIDIAEKATQNGATLLTHLFNAMPPFHHRDPGIIGLLGSKQVPFYSIICDGIHLHPYCVNFAWKAAKERAIVITDAISAMGLSNGTYFWPTGERLLLTDGKVTIEGSDVLAGSAITLADSVRNLIKFTDASFAEAITTVTSNPAQMLGGDIALRKGHLQPGADADLCITDDNGHLLSVWKNGSPAWK